MAEFLVLVNGLPGSGKTTLAGRLSGALGAPLVSKDAIKEGLAPERAGIVASETMWEVAAELAGLVVLEWVCRERAEAVRESAGRRDLV